MADPKADILAGVPALEELLDHGAEGDQVASAPLSIGNETTGWVLWFVRRSGGLVILTPLGGLRAGARVEAIQRCNEYNAALRWGTMACVEWDSEDIVVLAARLPLVPDADARWASIAQSMTALLGDAVPCRAQLADLLEDDGVTEQDPSR